MATSTSAMLAAALANSPGAVQGTAQGQAKAVLLPPALRQYQGVLDAANNGVGMANDAFGAMTFPLPDPIANTTPPETIYKMLKAWQNRK